MGKKGIGFLVAGMLGVAVLVFLTVLPRAQGLSRQTGMLTLPDGTQMRVLVSSTMLERTRGLGGFDGLPEDAGMLFLFEKHNIPAFWMKGMHFDLDMIWIDGNVVAGIHHDVPVEDPPRTLYSPDRPVDKVLEVPAGYAERHGLKVGDWIDITLFSQEVPASSTSF